MNNYLHNFACWSASRAIHNPHISGTKTTVIKKAIENSGLENYISNPNLLDNYSISHDNLVKKLNKELGWDLNERYGVVAKIIAIYFKVSIIIPCNASKKIMEQIYPPFDSINIIKLGLVKYKWTNLNKDKFKYISNELKNYCLKNHLTFIDFESENVLHK